jgi:hypothetical protein
LSEFAGFDLDRNTSRAWSRFQARLADHIAEMTDEDSLVIDAEVAAEELDGAAPYVQLAGFGDGTMVRGEVSGNAYLAEPYELTAGQCEQLSALGWHEPTVAAGEPEGTGSANFFVDLPVSEADRLAVMSVKALREVFGVPHPAFLAAGDLVDLDDEVAAGQGTVVRRAAEEPLATVPRSDEELRSLVDAALTPLFGETPKKDDDGDIPVPWGSSLVFVRVEEDVPIVQLFSIVVEGVTDLPRAAFEVNVLNRDLRFMKFVLVEDRVIAQVHLPAWPFVPEHLRSVLTGMSQKIDDLDEDLVARIGGRRAFDEPEEPAADTTALSRETTSIVSPDTALQTLLQLDADGSGAVDPQLAAAVCGHDQELIVRLLHQTEEQENAWRKSRDQALLDGDAAEAAACDHELRAWEQTTSVLRRALRFVVERRLGRDTSGSSYSSSGRPAAHMAPPARRRLPPRPRHRRHVEELDDLLRAYRVDDLVLLDEALSGATGLDVEVFDTDEGIEVVVDGQAGELAYPFTLADLDALVEGLQSASAEEPE